MDTTYSRPIAFNDTGFSVFTHDRKANPENDTNIFVLIIVFILELLMGFGILTAYKKRKEKKKNSDEQFLKTSDESIELQQLEMEFKIFNLYKSY